MGLNSNKCNKKRYMFNNRVTVQMTWIMDSDLYIVASAMQMTEK